MQTEQKIARIETSLRMLSQGDVYVFEAVLGSMFDLLINYQAVGVGPQENELEQRLEQFLQILRTLEGSNPKMYLTIIDSMIDLLEMPQIVSQLDETEE